MEENFTKIHPRASSPSLCSGQALYREGAMFVRKRCHDHECAFMPYTFDLNERARKLRKNMTKAEKILWGVLRGRSFKGLKFQRQKPLYRYIADFYCAELQLVIEVDGAIHEKRTGYDLERTCELFEFGITVIRYSNEQVIHSLKEVLNDLSQQVAKLKT
jgi:very-short-patch-repair endonuclease